MKTLWRVVLVLALLASAILFPLQMRLVAYSGTFGFVTHEGIANAPSVTRHVIDVARDSPAWRAGLRAGDALPLANVERSSRIALNYVLPGDGARYDVQRGTQTFPIHLVAVQNAPYAIDPPDAIRAFAMLSVGIFALLVVLRAWNTEYGPLIATLLTATVLDAAGDRIPWTPATANVIGAALFGNNGGIDDVCTALAMVLPVVLAGRLIGWHSNAFRVAAGCIAALAAFVLVYCPIGIYLRHTGMAGSFAGFTNDWVLNSLTFLAGAVALLVAYVSARGESRQRLRWIFWGFFPYLTGVGVLNATYDWSLTSIVYFEHPQVYLVAGSILRAMELALPVSLFYGVLLRRVVDIGFVVNRVAVYAALSVILVSLFVVLEFALSKVLLETGRVGSLAIQLGIALVIGFSGRYLHGIIDRFIDRVLFAKRHADESALRRFAREAEVYTSANALLDRTMETLRDHSEARGSAIYVIGDACANEVRTSGPEFPASVNLDDELLVRLRRWNEPVDTHDVKTALPDGMVFPMSVRGKLAGALACETKRDFSAFDPDERESLLEVARGLGAALDALSTKSDGAVAVLQASIAEMTAAIVTTLGEKIDSLRQKTADI
ncbi:MAG: hypothetical protein JO092_09090 [Candidatus Eremiobacteraeota bacterium]|nr:hypothetical protein [Candidatus Eremiobacteraeota bacterium]